MRPWRRPGAAPVLVVLTDAAWSIERLPIPSILATGAVHTALTAAGLRGRTDLAVSAVDVLDVHAMAMVLAVGATAVQPRLAIELAAELAGTRGAETLTAAATIDGLVSAFEAGLRKTLARMGISAVASYIGGALIDVVDLDAVGRRPMLPDGRGVARADDAGRPRRPAAPPAGGRAGDPGAGRRPRATPAGPRLRPVPRGRRGPPVLAADRRRDPGPRGGPCQRRTARHRRGAGALPDRARPARHRPLRPARRASGPAGARRDAAGGRRGCAPRSSAASSCRR